MPDDDDTTRVPIGVDTNAYERWLDAKQAYDEVKAHLDVVEQQLRDQITSGADGHNALVLVDGRPVGRYTKVASARVDTKRLKAEWPDIARQYVRETSFWRLTWTKS